MCNKEIQTDINTIKEVNLQTENKDEIIFNKFINESCIIDDLKYVSLKELVYQYKTWGKINNILNSTDFEQYIVSNFQIKKMLNEKFNIDMKSVIGLNLKDIYYNFNFKNPLGKFEKFITESCVKLPTGKLTRTMIIESYEKWHKINKITDNFSNKKIGVDLSLFLDKYFFKDYFQDGISSYVGWYGVTTKENILKGTGITSSLHNKHKIYNIKFIFRCITGIIECEYFICKFSYFSIYIIYVIIVI